jgi:hypothetical protein
MAALGLAIVTHAPHNLRRIAGGVERIIVIVTSFSTRLWAVVAWSMVEQREC